jgi:hypothetical protein
MPDMEEATAPGDMEAPTRGSTCACLLAAEKLDAIMPGNPLARPCARYTDGQTVRGCWILGHGRPARVSATHARMHVCTPPRGLRPLGGYQAGCWLLG